MEFFIEPGLTTKSSSRILTAHKFEDYMVNPPYKRDYHLCKSLAEECSSIEDVQGQF